MSRRTWMLAAVVAATAAAPPAGADARERPTRAVPPPPAFHKIAKARTGEAAKKVTQRRRHRVRARTAANGVWYSARGDCYANGITVTPGSNTLGARLGETVEYRALLWNGYAWATYPEYVTFTRSQLNDGAVVNGYYVNELPAQAFRVGRNQYQRAAIQVYYPSRGYSDWNWAQYTSPGGSAPSSPGAPTASGRRPPGSA